MLAADILGEPELLAEIEACHAPIAQQVDRLRLALDQSWGGGYRLSIAELEDLEDVERHAVIDAVVAGQESPFVVVDGRIVCQGGIDAQAIIASRAGDLSFAPGSGVAPS